MTKRNVLGRKAGRKFDLTTITYELKNVSMRPLVVRLLLFSLDIRADLFFDGYDQLATPGHSHTM